MVSYRTGVCALRYILVMSILYSFTVSILITACTDVYCNSPTLTIRTSDHKADRTEPTGFKRLK